MGSKTSWIDPLSGFIGAQTFPDEWVRGLDRDVSMSGCKETRNATPTFAHVLSSDALRSPCSFPIGDKTRFPRTLGWTYIYTQHGPAGVPSQLPTTQPRLGAGILRFLVEGLKEAEIDQVALF